MEFVLGFCPSRVRFKIKSDVCGGRYRIHFLGAGLGNLEVSKTQKFQRRMTKHVASRSRLCPSVMLLLFAPI